MNALSIDVEEYFHANNLAPVAPATDWHRLPARAELSTRLILDILAARNIRATFFILGYIAERSPQLVRDVAKAGHEIASHGFSHQLVYEQTPEEFYTDIDRTKKLLEDLTGQEVLGYRAPSFSIRNDSLWAYDQLLKAGYEYDSSLHPIRHPRYSNRERSILPHRYPCQSGGSILVLPLAVKEFNVGGMKLRIPAAGGAYWRVLPKAICQNLLKSIVNKDKRDFIAYAHPWEFDTGQPYFKRLPWIIKLRHYGGVGVFKETFNDYLSRFPFGTVINYAVKFDGSERLRALHQKLYGA